MEGDCVVIMSDEKREAVFSEDRNYRYTLSIRWAEGPMCQFIGLNPSIADEISDDPTIRRCKGFAKAFGCGGMVMTNLFAWRSTDPSALLKVKNPIGEEGHFFTIGEMELWNRNDFYLLSTSFASQPRIACWGTHGKILYRAAKVKQFLSGLSCLKLTASGYPQHPLYLKSNLVPISYQ